MKLYRRSLTALLITLSCLFAIQLAASAPVPDSSNECTDIGPTMYNLGFGNNVSANLALSAPACFVLDAGGTGDTADSTVVRVPIEGSLMATDELPAFVIAAENNLATATSEQPEIGRGHPSDIGPTI